MSSPQKCEDPGEGAAKAAVEAADANKSTETVAEDGRQDEEEETFSSRKLEGVRAPRSGSECVRLPFGGDQGAAAGYRWKDFLGQVDASQKFPDYNWSHQQEIFAPYGPPSSLGLYENWRGFHHLRGIGGYYPPPGTDGAAAAYYWNPPYPPPPPPGSSVLSRESSRDDLTSMGDGQVFEYEDRFRVDRRKLELLMMGHFDPIKESAVDFFCRIGEETNTSVIWPSRLKIGAKSKKDPHIRVGGQEEGVKRAKARIMEFLDTRSNRVTMKMDVSYTDHSHVIGKGGNTIRRVMAETNCHIHFPDSNRSNPNEKSNQVSIAGEIDGVETARARVRELTPLIFCFDLPIISSLHNIPDVNDPYIRAIQDQYNIQVTFRQKQKNFHTTMVVVKGSECEAARVKEATLLLMEHLCGSNIVNHPNEESVGVLSLANSGDYNNQVVSMNMEISPQHHPVVLGKANMTLKLIMQRTNTTILFPDASDPNIPSIRKGSVTITGAIHNVYLARQQLIGSLPLVMMFDIHDESELEEGLVQQLQTDLDVSISIKPKARQSNKSVIIKAQERNAGAIYKARSLLLRLDEEPTKAVIPETYNIQAFSLASGITLPVHRTFSASSANMSNNNYLPISGSKFLAPPAAPPPLPTSSPGCYPTMMAPPVLPRPSSTSSYSHPPPASPFDGVFRDSVGGTPRPSPGTLMPTWGYPFPVFANVLPPNHPYLQKRQRQQPQPQGSVLGGLKSDSINNDRRMDGNNNDNMKFVSNSGGSGTSAFLGEGRHALGSSPIPGNSPRNSSPVKGDGNLSNNLAAIDLNQSSHTSIPTTCSDKDHSGSSGQTSYANNNNIFFGDRRAPGCEITQAKQQQQHCEMSDYDQKRLLATKAMHTKPTGEVRTPTPTWVGLGFSSSMPESVIREKLEEESSRRPLGKEESILEEEEGAVFETSTSSGQDLSGTSGASGSAPLALGSGVSSQPQRAGGAQTHQHRMLFGNSSAFDSLLLPHHQLGGRNGSGNGSDSTVISPDDDLPSLFARQGLAKYTDVFLRQEIDLRTFASLNDDDLKEIGIQTFGARKKLILLANKAKQAFQQKW